MNKEDNINWDIASEECISCYTEEEIEESNQKEELPVKDINWGVTSGVEVEQPKLPTENTQRIDWDSVTERQRNHVPDNYQVHNDISNFKDKSFKSVVDKKPCLELRTLFRNILNFSGRTRRREYFIGFMQLYSIILVLIVLSLSFIDINLTASLIACIVLLCFLFYASLNLCIRRLHDIGKSGFYIFTLFIPIWNIITALQIYFSNSKEDNKWGMNPKRFDNYDGRPLFSSVLLSLLMLVGAIGVISTVGISSITNSVNKINAANLYEKIEENYNNMYEEDTIINETIISDDSWKDELENHKKEDKKEYLWGDDTANHPWTTQPESYDSFAEPTPEQNVE